MNNRWYNGEKDERPVKTWPEYDYELVSNGSAPPGIFVWMRLPEDAADAEVLDIFIPFRNDPTKDGSERELHRMVASAVEDVRLNGSGT